MLYFSCKDSPQPNLYWYKRPRQSDTKFHKDPLVNMPAAMKAITVSGMPKANDPAGAVTMKGPGTKPDGDTLKNLRIGDGCFIAVADTPTGEHVGGGEMAGSKGTEWFIHGEVEWTDSNGKKDFCNVGAVVSFPSTQGTGQNAGKEFFKAKVDYKSGPEVKNILENKVNDPLPFNG